METRHLTLVLVTLAFGTVTDAKLTLFQNSLDCGNSSTYLTDLKTELELLNNLSKLFGDNRTDVSETILFLHLSLQALVLSDYYWKLNCPNITYEGNEIEIAQPQVNNRRQVVIKCNENSPFGLVNATTPKEMVLLIEKAWTKTNQENLTDSQGDQDALELIVQSPSVLSILNCTQLRLAQVRLLQEDEDGDDGDEGGNGGGTGGAAGAAGAAGATNPLNNANVVNGVRRILANVITGNLIGVVQESVALRGPMGVSTIFTDVLSSLFGSAATAGITGVIGNATTQAPFLVESTTLSYQEQLNLIQQQQELLAQQQQQLLLAQQQIQQGALAGQGLPGQVGGLQGQGLPSGTLQEQSPTGQIGGQQEQQSLPGQITSGGGYNQQQYPQTQQQQQQQYPQFQQQQTYPNNQIGQQQQQPQLGSQVHQGIRRRPGGQQQQYPEQQAYQQQHVFQQQTQSIPQISQAHIPQNPLAFNQYQQQLAGGLQRQGTNQGNTNRRQNLKLPSYVTQPTQPTNQENESPEED